MALKTPLAAHCVIYALYSAPLPRFSLEKTLATTVFVSEIESEVAWHTGAEGPVRQCQARTCDPLKFHLNFSKIINVEAHWDAVPSALVTDTLAHCFNWVPTMSTPLLATTKHSKSFSNRIRRV